MKKELIEEQARKEFRDKELEDLRKKAKKEVEEIVKEKVKKDLLKVEYDRILKEEMAAIEGSVTMYVPFKISLGDKSFVGNCVMTTGEAQMVREILTRSKIEVENQTQRKTYASEVTMSGTGQTLSNTGMRRKQ